MAKFRLNRVSISSKVCACAADQHAAIVEQMRKIITVPRISIHSVEFYRIERDRLDLKWAFYLWWLKSENPEYVFHFVFVVYNMKIVVIAVNIIRHWRMNDCDQTKEI